jgi:hypothetical protein
MYRILLLIVRVDGGSATLPSRNAQVKAAFLRD